MDSLPSEPPNKPKHIKRPHFKKEKKKQLSQQSKPEGPLVLLFLMLRCDVMRPDGGKKESPTVTPFRVISSRQERNCCQTAPKYSNGGSAGGRLNSPAVGCCVQCRFGKLLSGGALAEPWQAASEALSLGTKDYLHPHWFSPAMSTHALVASGKEKEALLPAASPPSPLLSSCFSIWSIF